MKTPLIICLLAFAAFVTCARAQSFDIFGYEIATADGCRITLSLEGKISHIAFPPGKIIRDLGGTIKSVGAINITRDIAGTIIIVGNARIARDIAGNITSIGDVVITRDIAGTITGFSGGTDILPVFSCRK